MCQHKIKTFNSCMSRSDVCQCLVVQTPLDNMSKNKPSISMSQIASESESRSVVRSSMHLWLGKLVQSCFVPGLPSHLVQELNDGTVRGKPVASKDDLPPWSTASAGAAVTYTPHTWARGDDGARWQWRENRLTSMEWSQRWGGRYVYSPYLGQRGRWGPLPMKREHN